MADEDAPEKSAENEDIELAEEAKEDEGENPEESVLEEKPSKKSDEPPPVPPHPSESTPTASQKTSSDKDKDAPIGPPLNIDKIISETVDIIKKNQEMSDQQKHQLSKYVYMINRLRESLTAYKNHVDTLNRFFVNNDMLQSEWYYRKCQQLPCYGDYLRILKAGSSENVKLPDCKRPIPEKDLRELVEKVVNNFYAGGAHIRTQRLFCKGLAKVTDEREKFIDDTTQGFPRWLHLFEIQAKNQEKLAEKMFEILSFIDFLKTDGENAEPLNLDLSGLRNKDLA